MYVVGGGREGGREGGDVLGIGMRFVLINHGTFW